MSPVPFKGPTPRFYHQELDGLRFLAFLAVFLHHAYEVAPPQSPLPYAIWWSGTVGVDVFFVLSGYLITELLRRETEQFGNVHLLSFYARRCLRIWPLYFLMFAIAWWSDSSLFALPGLSGTEAVLYATFLGNWSCIWHGFPASVASALWSVSIEEQFYVLWPLIVGRFTPQRITIAALGLLLVGTATRIVGVAQGWSDLTLYTGTFTHLEGLACGALLAARLNGDVPRLSGSTRVGLWCMGLAIPVLAFLWTGMGLDGRSDWGLIAQAPLIAAASLLIVVSTLRPSGESAGLLATPLFVWLGVISYGLYVWHRPILRFMLILFATNRLTPPVFVYAGICLILTIATAALSYLLFERPFLSWKKHLQRDTPGSHRAHPATSSAPAHGLSTAR
jgi:peptidoglycan/LPS O-acetylase OafA/YrhL